MAALPAYQPDATCSKCGHDGVETEYVAESKPFLGYQCTTLGCGRDEHFHRWCSRCRFSWAEATLQAAGGVGRAEGGAA